ncbi:MFS multidrug transporter-like protein [Tricladium varicosporioides]|nr:MFS multidrug transporter-like protein [Hymenoscyphus varicosporioides]
MAQKSEPPVQDGPQQEKKEAESNSLKNEEVTSGDNTPQITYLRGPRLWIITGALSIMLFLTNLEIPIVTTSLISITNDLNSFSESSWIISAYMLGYVSMLIIWAKLSDIFGRKCFAVTAVATFTIFSGACGASQSMTQLIALRAFQGLGGGGNFALASIIFIELVPPELYPKYTSSVSVVFSISLLLGPIIGGALNNSGTWRWIFLLNVPLGVLAGIALLICLPNNFPYHGQTGQYRQTAALPSKETFRRVDFLGAALLLIATTLLVAPLEEAGQKYAWKSSFVVVCLVISGCSWLVFVFWEYRVTQNQRSVEPVFPWRLMTSRTWMGMTFNALFLGAPWFVTIFQLPQRFQVVNNASALSAGIRLVPFTLAAPIGSVVSAAIAGKFKVPPIYLVIGGSCLQVIGFALLSTLPLIARMVPEQYGYQVIAGFGVGINISTLIVMTPYSIKEARDKAVAIGAVSQFRIMGGVIGLAIVTAVYKGYVNSRLDIILTESEKYALLQSTESLVTLTPAIQEQVRVIYAGGYNLQFRILIAFAAAQIPASFMMWQSKQIIV